jgi:hypothetical protein
VCDEDAAQQGGRHAIDSRTDDAEEILPTGESKEHTILQHLPHFTCPSAGKGSMGRTKSAQGRVLTELGLVKNDRR